MAGRILIPEATFTSTQNGLPEAPEALARTTHMAMSFQGLVMLTAATDRRVRIYTRDRKADHFRHANNFDCPDRKEFIADLAITENGLQSLLGDKSGRLFAFSTTIPAINTQLCTNVDCGTVVSCSISLNYILASFYDEKKGNSCMCLWRRPGRQITSGNLSLVKMWTKEDIGDEADLLYTSCVVRNAVVDGTLVPQISYHCDKTLCYIFNVDPFDEDNEACLPKCPKPLKTAIIEASSERYLCAVTRNGQLIRFKVTNNELREDQERNEGMAKAWKVEGVVLTQTISFSFPRLNRRGSLDMSLAVLDENRTVVVYRAG